MSRQPEGALIFRWSYKHSGCTSRRLNHRTHSRVKRDLREAAQGPRWTCLRREEADDGIRPARHCLPRCLRSGDGRASSRARSRLRSGVGDETESRNANPGRFQRPPARARRASVLSSVTGGGASRRRRSRRVHPACRGRLGRSHPRSSFSLGTPHHALPGCQPMRDWQLPPEQ